MKQVKTTSGKLVYIHYVPFTMNYVVVSEHEEKKKLFKLSLAEIDEDQIQFGKYLLGEVQKRYPDIDRGIA